MRVTTRRIRHARTSRSAPTGTERRSSNQPERRSPLPTGHRHFHMRARSPGVLDATTEVAGDAGGDCARLDIRCNAGKPAGLLSRTTSTSRDIPTAAMSVGGSQAWPRHAADISTDSAAARAGPCGDRLRSGCAASRRRRRGRALNASASGRR